jgi:flagellar basal body-associated protein FliL
MYRFDGRTKREKVYMDSLALLVLSTMDSGSTRLLLLLLLLLGVVLILTGCTIALLTFRKQRKTDRANLNPASLESERT